MRLLNENYKICRRYISKTSFEFINHNNSNITLDPADLLLSFDVTSLFSKVSRTFNKEFIVMRCDIKID